MKKFTLILSFVLLNVICFAQENSIVGAWSFVNITTTNADCKSVSKDNFQINQFIFSQNNVKIIGKETNIKGSYEFKNNRIRFYNCTENGQDLEGDQFMNVTSISDDLLVLNINYECGAISIIFDKKNN